jgi:hypothetical protein
LYLPPHMLPVEGNICIFSPYHTPTQPTLLCTKYVLDLLCKPSGGTCSQAVLVGLPFVGSEKYSLFLIPCLPTTSLPGAYGRQHFSQQLSTRGLPSNTPSITQPTYTIEGQILNRSTFGVLPSVPQHWHPSSKKVLKYPLLWGLLKQPLSMQPRASHMTEAKCSIGGFISLPQGHLFCWTPPT